MLLSFAQFERELIAERTRDKIAPARRKGKWVGGMPLLGYDIDPQGPKLRVNNAEAARVRAIFALYLGALGRPERSVTLAQQDDHCPGARVGHREVGDAISIKIPYR